MVGTLYASVEYVLCMCPTCICFHVGKVLAPCSLLAPKAESTQTLWAYNAYSMYYIVVSVSLHFCTAAVDRSVSASLGDAREVHCASHCLCIVCNHISDLWYSIISKYEGLMRVYKRSSWSFLHVTYM